MNFPDCRRDKSYNQAFLSGTDKEWLRGFDFAIEMMMVLFDNLDEYPELEDILTDNKAVIMEGKADLVKGCLETHMESERNMAIVGMIDDMDDDLFNAIYNKYMKEHPDADFYDTQSFKEIAKRSAECYG